METSILIFCKAPILGLVKTRLAASVGPVRALSIYNELALATQQAISEFKEVHWIFTPDHDEARSRVMEWIIRPEWSLRPQKNGDLGERLKDGFNIALKKGPAMAIGTDCPYITSQDLKEANTVLQNGGEKQVVFGPAKDGGYWLIGMNRFHPGIFENIPWSSESTLEVTVNRAQELGLNVHLLRELSDVDTQEDWETWKNNRGV